MKRRFKATTAVVMAATMMAPTMAFAQSSAQEKEISVDIESKSVVLGQSLVFQLSLRKN